VLSDRERTVLARIEQELTASDPAFVRMFVAPRRRRLASGPALLLALGLAVMVLGSAIISVEVAVLGIGIAVVALFAAYHRPMGFFTT
jgi:Protein of unknown function (DUF3040)